jgi:26S proteasome regulatory subunit N2
MKDDSAAKHGDVSPIALAEDAKTSGKRKEPSSEELSNFARVTPAQLGYISFNSNGRYQPVRPVSSRVAGKGKGSKANSGEKFAGGGGILILEDRMPDEPVEYLEFQTLAPLPQAQPAAAPAEAAERDGGPRGVHIALDENEPEAEAPPPFEVSDTVIGYFTRSVADPISVISILLARTHEKIWMIARWMWHYGSTWTCRIIKFGIESLNLLIC